MNKILLFFFLVISSQIFGQRIITGKVISKDDKTPIPGVNVIEKGSSNGTTTDMNGRFELRLTMINPTLVFSFVGYVTEEVALQKDIELLVVLKSDCIIDFFDANDLDFWISSGVINNPIGAQTKISLPLFFGRGTIKALISHQTDLSTNNFTFTQLRFAHYIANCNFYIDFDLNARLIRHNKSFSANVYSFEPTLNKGNLSVLIGYSQLHILTDETSPSSRTGSPVIGLGIFFNLPTHPTLTASFTPFKDNYEYRTSIEGNYRRFVWFARYYRLNSFNELTLGTGIHFNYIKRRKQQEPN